MTDRRLEGVIQDVALLDLTPMTKAEDLAGNDASYLFVTSPPAGTSKPTRIWVLGDSGTANSSAQAVRNAYLTFTGTRHTDL